jgi:DNA-binding transcriptional ArsR family regulator
MNLPPYEEINLLHANICRALADPKRILLLYAIYEKPRHVSALAEYLSIPQPTVSRHLRILRHQSLVVSERDGSSVVYHIADLRIIDVLEIMRQVLYDSMTRRSDLLQSSLTV